MKTPFVESITPLGFPFQTHDPFLFCVHHRDAYPAGNENLGPNVSLEGREIGQDFSYKDGFSMYHGDVVPGFPQHPHRGFETVTIAKTGIIDHSDSLGAKARFGRGDVQWLTAGRGIVHSEMFPLLLQDADNPAELFQIWLNLPARSKMVEPYFSMFWHEHIPRITVTDDAGKRTEVVVVAGAFPNGPAPPSPPPNSWASVVSAQVAIWTLRLESFATFVLPKVEKGVGRSLYFYQGSGLFVGDVDVPEKSGLRLQEEVEVPLRAGEQAVELLLLQGRPIGEPVFHYGPFVMNSRDQLRQAFIDYERTRFGGWPHESDGPTHPREEGRFALHGDGRLERP